ncbi:hypothetical protein NITLEN_80042 [Nitrospira lenta]|uniref:Uncharacterized protein n=1 Tax=Nitrospira lenta TaxID=1436998 RepID=A0A330LBD8_9BACT|nr:hypothetical protein NITLEN_80042 [Nitrospira lenta]
MKRENALLGITRCWVLSDEPTFRRLPVFEPFGCVFSALGYDGTAVASVGSSSSTGMRVHRMVAVFPVRPGL